MTTFGSRLSTCNRVLQKERLLTYGVDSPGQSRGISPLQGVILGEVKARPKDIISFSLDYISKSKVQTSNPSSSPISLDTPARPADLYICVIMYIYIYTFCLGGIFWCDTTSVCPTQRYNLNLHCWSSNRWIRLRHAWAAARCSIFTKMFLFSPQAAVDSDFSAAVDVRSRLWSII